MKALLGLLMFLAATPALANPYFAGNPWSPIPPGCLTLPKAQKTLYGDNRVKFWEGQVRSGGNWWPADGDPNPNQQVALAVRMYRIGCAEPNRSAIVAEIQVAESNRVIPPQVPVLYFSAHLSWDGGRIVPLLALAEPTEWRDKTQDGSQGQAMLGDYTGGWIPMQGYTWTYLIDAPGPGSTHFSPDWHMSAREYNEAFDLHIHIPGSVWVTVPVPATRDVLARNPRLPLNGRLSGGWVIDGATDQGLVLSFANRVPAAAAAPALSPLLLFLSWYTFDVDGNPLWLTGTAEFAQGTSQVDIPIALVTGGEFLGSRRAERAVAGVVTLTARGCDDLQLEYDLPGVGLGSGISRLQRLAALEVAGYNCRDYESRRGQIELFPSF
ncbi:MAG: hypothetical protein HKN58_00125 [Xanthomonadales bacterium]|nr:hypothetical protein [Xanthomonadales bacterium]